MAAIGRCWPHIHSNMDEMQACRDYRLATLFAIDGPAPERAGSGRLGHPSQPVSAARSRPGIADAPLATPSIFIRLHRRHSRAGELSRFGGRSLLLSVIVAVFFVGLALIGLTSWLRRRITGE